MLTILGCGSSGGVPRVGGDWGVCNPDNPKNRRSRCSVLVTCRNSSGTTRLLIDSSPDLRQQMLSANVSSLDGVLYSHEHADHLHGIDDLRAFFLKQKQLIPVWADEVTAQTLLHRFGYCFQRQADSSYPPILALQLLFPGVITSVGQPENAIEVLPIALQHGLGRALGFRIGNMAYTPDVSDIPDESILALSGLDLWVVDALRRTPHPSHFSLQRALDWIETLRPKSALLTNMHTDLDYSVLQQELPQHVRPAYDGLEVFIESSDLR